MTAAQPKSTSEKLVETHPEHSHSHDDHDHSKCCAGHKKLGRNDPCLCGSGKKYKKCCLHKQ